MGIDYTIRHGCVPKEQFTSRGLLEHIKAGERAHALIEFYRQNNDTRPIDEMGGEIMRRAADGEEEVQTIMVKDLLAQHAKLEAVEHHCEGCPANFLGRRFGCIGHINYPISQAAEVWMLSHLPSPEESLPFLLLSRAEEFGFTGKNSQALRKQSPGIIFESHDTLGRHYPEMDILTDQLFELFFLLEEAIPIKRIVMILLFMNAIKRDLDADSLMKLTPAPANPPPFLLHPADDDDTSIIDLKVFLRALYHAYTLNCEVSLDV